MKTVRDLLWIFALAAGLAAAVSGQAVLTSLDGGTVDVEAQSGKVVVLAIGASWLPLSAKQAEVTNALAKKYQGKPVVFYFIATDSTDPHSKNYAEDATIRKFAATAKLGGITILRDSDGTVTTKKYGIEQIPSFVILDKKGVSQFEPFGGLDPKYDAVAPISRAIDKLL